MKKRLYLLFVVGACLTMGACSKHNPVSSPDLSTGDVAVDSIEGPSDCYRIDTLTNEIVWVPCQ